MPEGIADGTKLSFAGLSSSDSASSIRGMARLESSMRNSG